MLWFNYGQYDSQCSNGQYGSIGQYRLVQRNSSRKNDQLIANNINKSKQQKVNTFRDCQQITFFTLLNGFCLLSIKNPPHPVMYPGHLGAQYTGLGTQTLAPKKGFLTFYLKIFFKHPQRRVFCYSIYII